MANCGLLLNDGTSFLLLNDGSSFLLLNDNSCTTEPDGSVPAPVATPAAPAAAPDSGFDKFMEEFARERTRERQLRENEEIMRIAAFEEEFILNLLKRLL